LIQQVSGLLTLQSATRNKENNMDGSSSSSVEMQEPIKRTFSVRRDAVISRKKDQPVPQVGSRDDFDSAIKMLGHDQVEKFHDKLARVNDEWKAELDKLEKVLGTDAFQELLRTLDKETVPELVDLRDRAYALKEILASRPIQNVLHSKVKRMDKWDASSRAVLNVVRSQQQGENVMSARKQSAIYYSWSVASAARASAFVASMYSASKALTAVSVTCTAAVPLLAIFHTVTMVRDLYRTEDSFYKERAKAYANMDQALMFMKNIGNPSLADAGGVLKKFNEDDFVAAVEQVWSQRREATGAYDAKAKLYQVRLVADHIVRAHEQCGVDITRKMRKTDAALLLEYFSEQEVSGCREQLRQYLNAQVLIDRKAKANAALNLSRMPLVQRLICESKSDAPRECPLFFALQCREELKPIRGRLDVDQTVEKMDDPDDIIITLSDSDDIDSDSDAANDYGKDAALVINIEDKLKGASGADSDSDPKVSTEDSMSETTGAAPIFTPRRRGRMVQRIFDREAARRDNLMGEFESALTNKVNGDDDVLSSLANSSADADQGHMNDRY
jgi:hypothetical protein